MKISERKVTFPIYTQLLITMVSRHKVTAVDTVQKRVVDVAVEGIEVQSSHWCLEILKSSQTLDASSLIKAYFCSLGMSLCDFWFCPLSHPSFSTRNSPFL